MTETTGQCRCGQVQITVSGPPMLTMACHCTGCQRMTASAFSLSALYHDGAVSITGTTVPGGLKAGLDHRFCRDCLSWVFTRADVLGPLINIRSTMLQGGADTAPFIECWTDERLPWVDPFARHAFAQFPPEDQFPALLAEYAARGDHPRGGRS